MIGALLLEALWKRRTERAFADRDVEAMMRLWDPHGVLEFGGTNGMSGRFVGEAEIRAWMERWFTRMRDLRVTVGRVAVARPWALGLTNTVMYELHVEETSYDGRTVSADLVSVADLRRGRLVHVRDFPFDETPELLMWGPHRDEARP